jgi:hypothetical protein
MWDADRRRRTAECLSDLALDQLLLGEGPEAVAAAARAHLLGCAACTEAHAARQEDRDRFAQESDLAALARDALARAAAAPPPPSRWRWLAGSAAVGAAALGLTIALLVPGGLVSPSGGRAKGGFAITMFVKHAETPAHGSLHLGEPLHPGDQVRFRLSSDVRGYVAVLAADAAGKVSVYHPTGRQAAALEAGADEPLPNAVALDSTLGREVIIALRCERPVDVETLVSALDRTMRGARPLSDPAATLPPLGVPCVEARYEIAKRTGGPAR